MSEMQVPLYTSFKSNNMDIIYFEKNYSLPLTMAPAAARTISDFLKDSESAPSDYDLILTGIWDIQAVSCFMKYLKRSRISTFVLIITTVVK